MYIRILYTYTHMYMYIGILDIHTAVEQIRPVSQIILCRQKALLGHIIRADEDDPMFQVSFDNDFQVIADTHRRSGRPRQHLLEQNLKRVYYEYYGETYDESNILHRENIVGKAVGREF